MQTFCCNHCGLNCETMFSVFLHIFTDHMHTDIGLEKDECQRLIGKTQPYKLKTRAIECKADRKSVMRVELDGSLHSDENPCFGYEVI
jgi:hypothetical protein